MPASKTQVTLISPSQDARAFQLIRTLMAGTGMRSNPYAVLWIGCSLALIRYTPSDHSSSPSVHRVALVDPKGTNDPPNLVLPDRVVLRPILGCIHLCTQRPKRGVGGPTHGLLVQAMVDELINESTLLDAQWPTAWNDAVKAGEVR